MLKTADDGIGPIAADVVAIQETYRSHARDIALHLSTLLGYEYRLAVHGSDFGLAADIRANTALIYNTESLNLLDVASAVSFDDGPEDHKAHVLAAFSESASGTRFAVGSIHLVNGHAYKTTPGYNVNQIRNLRAEWVEEIAGDMQGGFADHGVMKFIMTGDFNEVRCLDAPAPAEMEADVPADIRMAGPLPYVEPPTCVERPMHQSLTQSGYTDALLSLYRPAMIDQYRDGLEARSLRIDHVFTKNVTPPRGSFDLTCGVTKGGESLEKHSCDYLRNQERYSDHRLLWMQIELSAVSN